MEAVSRDSNIGTFRIIFLLYSRSSVDSGASLEREHLGAFNRPSVMTVTSEENQKTQPGFKPRLPGFLILSFFASIRTIRLGASRFRSDAEKVFTLLFLKGRKKDDVL